MEFVLQPGFYSSKQSSRDKSSTLLDLLRKMWNVNTALMQEAGTIFILSGFSNFNGGVPFYDFIEGYVALGGRCEVILGGSASQKLSSKQVVRKLLQIGCQVSVINRNAILHAKCYGYETDSSIGLIVSSGNFTSRGISQNVEASLSMLETEVPQHFSWRELFDAIYAQPIDLYRASLNETEPVWALLFDEDRNRAEDANDTLSTMILTLGHSDTVRIMARPNTNQSKGTQYFWLPNDALDFFPPLNLRNNRGRKAAYQTTVSVHYIDLNSTRQERVTFEAENNRDFRLGTSQLRNTRLADNGDLAAITRTENNQYEIRLYRNGTELYNRLEPYAVNFIGHRGKKYGYIPNALFSSLIR